jgi:hypothetical protein
MLMLAAKTKDQTMFCCCVRGEKPPYSTEKLSTVSDITKIATAALALGGLCCVMGAAYVAFVIPGFLLVIVGVCLLAYNHTPEYTSVFDTQVGNTRVHSGYNSHGGYIQVQTR